MTGVTAPKRGEVSVFSLRLGASPGRSQDRAMEEFGRSLASWSFGFLLALRAVLSADERVLVASTGGNDI